MPKRKQKTTPAATAIPDGAYLHDGKLYVQESRGYFTAPKQLDTVLPSGSPSVGLNIQKIPLALWLQSAQFLKDSYDKYKFETQISWFFHPEKKTWTAEVFEQESAGMTTNLVENSPLNESIRERLEKEGYDTSFECTGHHHCTSSAFASGTDKHDEEDRPGLHFTLGNMSSAKFDFHGRCSVYNPPVVNNNGEVEQPASYDNWTFKWVAFKHFIEVPDHVVDSLKAYYRDPASSLLEDIGLVRYSNKQLYPDEWIDRCSKKTYKPMVQSGKGMPLKQGQQGILPIGTDTEGYNEEAFMDSMPPSWLYGDSASLAAAEKASTTQHAAVLEEYILWLDNTGYYLSQHEETLNISPEKMVRFPPDYFKDAFIDFIHEAFEELGQMNDFEDVWKPFAAIPIKQLGLMVKRAIRNKLTPDYLAFYHSDYAETV